MTPTSEILYEVIPSYIQVPSRDGEQGRVFSVHTSAADEIWKPILSEKILRCHEGGKRIGIGGYRARPAIDACHASKKEDTRLHAIRCSNL